MLAPTKRQAIARGLEAGGLDAKKWWSPVSRGVIDHYFEKLMLGFRPFAKLRAMVARRTLKPYLADLDQALAQGKGVIMVTGHFGAVEYLPLVLTLQGYEVSVMVHCKSQSLKEALEERASRMGAELMDPKTGNVLFEALHHLKRGRIVLTQCDEISQWRPYRDREVTFLGNRVGLDRSLDLLQRKSGAPVILGLLHRRPKGHYQLELTPLSPVRREETATLVSHQCLSILSQRIGQEPAAWYEWKKLATLAPKRIEKHEPAHQWSESLSHPVAAALSH